MQVRCGFPARYRSRGWLRASYVRHRHRLASETRGPRPHLWPQPTRGNPSQPWRRESRAPSPQSLRNRRADARSPLTGRRQIRERTERQGHRHRGMRQATNPPRGRRRQDPTPPGARRPHPLHPRDVSASPTEDPRQPLRYRNPVAALRHPDERHSRLGTLGIDGHRRPRRT